MAAALSHLHGKLGSSISSVIPRSNRVRPITITASISYWAVIEAHLKKSITIRPPLSVFEPMHHLTFAAPKSTAPPLCVAACEVVGGSPEDAVTAASAIHLMDVAAFTHRHLPLTDRPRPVVHDHVYDPNIELLLPDGIVPYGFELLGRSELAQKNPDRILRVIIEISRAIGWQGIEEEKKEGELHACAAACGAIIGGGSEVEIEKLRKFGVYVGMIEGIGKNKEILREKAVKELGIFSGKKLDQIYSFIFNYE